MKSKILTAWSHVKDCQENRWECIDTHVPHVRALWEIGVDDSETRTEGAKKLEELFRAELDKLDECKVPDNQVKGKDDDEGELGWWWEIHLQRDQPADGAPAVALELFSNMDSDKPYNGRWWFTHVCPADEVGSRAMSAMSDDLFAGSY